MCMLSYPFFFHGLTAVHVGLEYQHGGRWFMYALLIRLFFAVYCANRSCYYPGVWVSLQSLQVFEMRPVFVRGVYCPWTCATTHRLIGAMSGTAPQLDSPLASLCVCGFTVLRVLSFHVCHACLYLSFSMTCGDSCAPVFRQYVSVDASR